MDKETLLKAFAEMQSVEEQKSALSTWIKEHSELDNLTKRTEFAELLLEVVRLQLPHADVCKSIFNEKEITFADVPVIRTKAGLKAYVTVPGSDTPRSVQTASDTLVEPERLSAFTDVTRAELGSGRVDTLNELSDELLNQIVGQKTYKMWTTMKAGASVTTENYVFTANTTWGYNTLSTYQDRLNKAIEIVYNYAGDVAAIIGLPAPIMAITNFTTVAYSEVYKAKRDSTIMLPTYRGIPLVMIQQFRADDGTNDYEGTALMDTDRVLVVSGTAGKALLQGGIDIDQVKKGRAGKYEVSLETYFAFLGLDLGRRSAFAQYV